MRALPPALLAVFLATSAAAQTAGTGGSGGEITPNLRSFQIRNDSKVVVTGVKLISTDAGKVMFQNTNPIEPNHGAEAKVNREQCLAEVDVTFKDGRTLRDAGLNDCKLTRISIGEDKILLESAAVQ